ncbi:DMT family transporter [Papillibacter cinnamivorans]|nr:DMT family transporter [Papillibacter cinnamivorans]
MSISMILKHNSGTAKLALLGAAFIWGSSFVVMKNTLSAMPTFYLLAIRFTMASALIAVLFRKHLRHLNREYWKAGGIMGLLLLGAYVSQTFGLAGTTPSKNAFLTAVYCVIVPFFYWLFLRKRPDRYNIAAAILCIAGIGFVSLNDDMSILPGDLLTLLCGFLYAGHIIAVAKFSREKDIFMLTLVQFVTAAVLAWVFGFVSEPFPAVWSASTTGSLFYLGIFATGIALLFQNIGQKYTEPTTASILLTMESVFGVICSVLFYHEQVTARMLMGFALIFVATICSETKFSFLGKKVHPASEGMGKVPTGTEEEMR